MNSSRRRNGIAGNRRLVPSNQRRLTMVYHCSRILGSLATAFCLVSSSTWVYPRETITESCPKMSRTTASGTPAALSQEFVV